MGSSHPTSLYSSIPRGFLENYNDTFARIFALEYRLASSLPFKSANHFPSQLTDALSGYHHLTNTLGFVPGNIIICGDSAGAHLAISLARYLDVSNLPSLSSPGGLLLLSPTVDWANARMGKPLSTMDIHEATDYVRPILANGYSATCIRGNLDPDELEVNVWLSPGSLKLPDNTALFSNLPPTFILAGGAEVSVDENVPGPSD